MTLGKGKRAYYAARAALALKQGDLFRLIKYRQLAEQLDMEGEDELITQSAT